MFVLRTLTNGIGMLGQQNQRNRQRLITLAILVVAGVVLVTVGARSGVLRPVFNLALTPLSPVARFLNLSTESAFNPPEETTLTQQELIEQNREYERIIAQMQVELVELREISTDYDRLALIVDYQTRHPDQNLVTADVIARDTSSYLRWIIINRGTRDGIQNGNPVITDLGLVGRVERVTANEAWIRLANDPASAIDARLQTARASGTVFGELQGTMRMENIPQSAEVESGDLVLTSGLGGTFPPDIVIGQVTSVTKQQAQLFQQAEVRSTVDFNNLDIVSVITSFEAVDTSVFDEAIEATPIP
jgi:rod shape-determining protein MreC